MIIYVKEAYQGDMVIFLFSVSFRIPYPVETAAATASVKEKRRLRKIQNFWDGRVYPPKRK